MTYRAAPYEFHGEVCQYPECGVSDRTMCKYPKTAAAYKEKEMDYINPAQYGQQRSPEKIMGTATRGASPIHGAVTQLEANIAGLDQVLGALHERLAPLMREEPNKEETLDVNTGAAPMTQALWAQAKKVEKLTLAVGSIIKRLEV